MRQVCNLTSTHPCPKFRGYLVALPSKLNLNGLKEVRNMGGRENSIRFYLEKYLPGEKEYEI